MRHSHALGEGAVCDWGFDAANWRFYISLDSSVPPSDRAERQMNRLLSGIHEADGAAAAAIL